MLQRDSDPHGGLKLIRAVVRALCLNLQRDSDPHGGLKLVLRRQSKRRPRFSETAIRTAD